MTNAHSDEEKQITRNLVEKCLNRISNGNSDAGLDLARIFLGEIPCEDSYILLAVIEALIQQAAELGSSDAKEYLDVTWPKMREISAKRINRRLVDGR